MGIPKFFRYISERWPLILQLIENDQIPEFDNLYLDMNSILHNCTHGNDMDNTRQRLSEEEVYAKIFAYIDHLLNTIKPKKVFYMAIDGVAPRAKMNQQRSRRFRTAMDAETALKKAIANGDELPKGEPFDSNSITPGTEFMAKLTRNLKYFIHDKISNDLNWQNIEVVFSGHEVPGEGEHKIMDFIRNLRSQKDYEQNTRHCIYGLDADLIMLGLSTHDPHFSLLREEVKFGGRRNNSGSLPLEKQNFYLLHLSLLREYMNLEFIEISTNLQFKYEFDRILDDFILIMFVIGNDFLPNLPDLHLNKGAFPVILQTFKEALLHLDGYINENGKINLKRLGVWLNYLSQFELMNFEKDDIDVDWFNKQLENISLEGEKKRLRQGKKLLLKQQKKIVGAIKPWLLNLAQKPIKELSNLSKDNESALSLELSDSNIVENLEFLKNFAFDLGLFVSHSKSKDSYSLNLDIDSINPVETEEEHQERIKSIKSNLKKYQNAILVEDKEELDNEQEIYDARFEAWKREYYQDKFNLFGSEKVVTEEEIKFDENDDTTNNTEIKRTVEYVNINSEEDVAEIARNYVEGLQWVLYYYYRGCPSWSWYYKGHYAPRISDLAKGLDQTFVFEKRHPFTPFQQLMAVLPERSKNLIPAVLRPLMFDEKSPILDFYPNEVQLDKNGKSADWEAVVLLSFVDEDRLVTAMQPYLEKLTPEEKERNSFGIDLTFRFNPQVDEVYKSPLNGVFSDIKHNHCMEIKFEMEKLDLHEIRYGLLPEAKDGKYLSAGFPSFDTIPFDAKLEYNETAVFQQPSKQQSMVIYINNVYEGDDVTIDEISNRFMKSIVYTKWPYLRESKLIGVSNGIETIGADEMTGKITKRNLSDLEKKEYNNLKNSMYRNYGKQQAVKIGDIKSIIKVVPVTGLARDSTGAYVKTFGSQIEYYPVQLMVDSIINVDKRFVEKPPQPIDQEFPEGSKVVFLGDYAYGGTATIDGYSSGSRLKLSVEKRSIRSEPTIGKIRHDIDKKLIKYQPSYIVSKTLKFHPLFLSKITSKYLVAGIDGRRVDVGIPIKFEGRRQKVLGYARRSVKGWEYSNLTIDLLNHYKKTFPEFIDKLARLKTNDIPNIGELYPELTNVKAAELLDRVKTWLKNATENFVTVSLESDSLSKASINAIEEAIIPYSTFAEQSEIKQLAKVPREAILDPKESLTKLRSQRFDLGDRVIYIQSSGKVPLFSKGTVVGYTTLPHSISVQVLFDNEIVAGNRFGGRLRTNRGLGLDASYLLNISNRQFIYHSKASKKTGGEQKNTAASIEAKKERVAKIRTARAQDLLTHINDNKSNTSAANDANIAPAAALPPIRHAANHIYSAVLNQYSNEGPATGNPQPISESNGDNQAGLPYHLPPGFVPPNPMMFSPPPHGPTGLPLPMGNFMHPPQGMFPPPVPMPMNGAMQHPPVDQKGSAELKSFIKNKKPQDDNKKNTSHKKHPQQNKNRNNGKKTAKNPSNKDTN
ncbi:hypothetical protein TPHA_0H00510 [Tetrapisispora phaffii CBS 4417]|uniref:5'-3' exoribonuclease 1 n=1 Tax=Tetrapisispora phaffii (strain ATCC 24235 / CBS 4417 / NBRC 1672 / NRRL Y-8282 / UCD 70-5) TaxID=1071381 RepID=G8BWV7_TETPH|nr:hypothetical protein TPHA_0H00510 [Tetrapisispora phaffii CBS 4417]CCE64261.1 hypothetical protein TPHA_0H00510 [Tetrapisispora phaffii CBS 4417]